MSIIKDGEVAEWTNAAASQEPSRRRFRRQGFESLPSPPLPNPLTSPTSSSTTLRTERDKFLRLDRLARLVPADDTNRRPTVSLPLLPSRTPAVRCRCTGRLRRLPVPVRADGGEHAEGAFHPRFSRTLKLLLFLRLDYWQGTRVWHGQEYPSCYTRLPFAQGTE